MYGPQPRCAWCGRKINRGYLYVEMQGTPLCCRRRLHRPPKCGDILLADELTDRNAEPKAPQPPRQS